MADKATTIEEVGKAAKELRAAVEKTHVDPDKIEKIQTWLDGQEERNQKVVQAELESKQHAEDIKELKASLEKAGVNEGEARARVDALEAELARGTKVVQADRKESDSYKAINAFCIHGYDFLPPEQKALLRTDSATEGGVLAPSEMDTEITKLITELNAIRSVARVRTIASKSLVIPKRTGIPTATYEGEQETGADSVSAYGSETMTPYRLTFTAPITLDQLMDAAFDMEAEIGQDAGEAFAVGEGTGFVLGTGFKAPAGFAANATLQAAARVSGDASLLLPNPIILMTGDLKVGYNPVYIMTRSTLALIRTFRGDAASADDQAGQYLWQPGMNGPVSNTLNGFPYILAPSMPEVASGAYPIAFGDFRRGYTITDRTGMTVVRDEFTLKKRGIVEFTMNKWNTGQVTVTEAIKLLKISA